MKHRLLTSLFLMSFLFSRCKESEILPHKYNISNTFSVNNYLLFSISEQIDEKLNKIIIYDLNKGVSFQMNIPNKNFISKTIIDAVFENNKLFVLVEYRDIVNFQVKKILLIEVSEETDSKILYSYETKEKINDKFSLKVFSGKLFLNNKFENAIYEISIDTSTLKLLYRQPYLIEDFYFSYGNLFIISQNSLIIQSESNFFTYRFENTDLDTFEYYNALFSNSKVSFLPITNGLLVKYNNRLIGYNILKKKVEFDWENISFIQQSSSNKHYYVIRNKRLFEFGEDFTFLNQDENINALIFLNETYYYNLIIGKNLDLTISVKKKSNTLEEFTFPMNSLAYQYLDVPTRQFKWPFKVFGNEILFYNGKNLLHFEDSKFLQISNTENLICTQYSFITYNLLSNKIHLYTNPFTSNSEIGVIDLSI